MHRVLKLKIDVVDDFAVHFHRTLSNQARASLVDLANSSASTRVGKSRSAQARKTVGEFPSALPFFGIVLRNNFAPGPLRQDHESAPPTPPQVFFLHPLGDAIRHPLAIVALGSRLNPFRSAIRNNATSNRRRSTSPCRRYYPPFR